MDRIRRFSNRYSLARITLKTPNSVTPLAFRINEADSARIGAMMSLHVLSAGTGYLYYTQETASGDELRAGTANWATTTPEASRRASGSDAELRPWASPGTSPKRRWPTCSAGPAPGIRTDPAGKLADGTTREAGEEAAQAEANWAAGTTSTAPRTMPSHRPSASVRATLSACRAGSPPQRTAPYTGHSRGCDVP